MKMFDLAIAIPGRDSPMDFTLSLVAMVLSLQKHAVPGYGERRVKIFNKRTSVAKARQGLVEDALAERCSHLLFLDTDQVFPPWTAHCLAEHKAPIVAANIATKIIPAGPTARAYNAEWRGGDPVYTDKESPRLQKVWRVGTGIMLINLGVFTNMPKPWFIERWDDEGQEIVGEDWYFCEKAEAAGFGIFVDHVLSRAVGHVGSYNYTHDVVGTVVKEEKAA